MNIGQQFIDIVTGKWAWVFFVSLIGSIGFVAMALPQFIKVLKTKNTTSLNRSYVAILPITNTLIMVYDIGLFVITYLTGQFPWAILFTIVFNGLISCYGTMIIKLTNYHKAKKLKMTEEQYYKKIIKPKIEAKHQKRIHK